MNLYAPIWAPPVPVSAAERLLMDAARRLARQRAAPPGWTALVLHLSALRPPAPRPHHRRVARAVLEDAARPHDGQVFPMRNGDLVLLCRAAGVAGLAGRLTTLLHADSADITGLVSLWPMPAQHAAFSRYAAARLADAPRPLPAEAELQAPPDGIAAMAALAEGPRAGALLRRRTAIELPAMGGMRAAHHHIGFALDAMTAAVGMSSAAVDPFLLRHLAGLLDRALLASLPKTAELRCAVPLTLPTVLAAGFGASIPLGIEISLLEAAADPLGFAAAAAALAGTPHRLILGGIAPAALLLADPWALPAAALAIDWQPALADPGTIAARALAGLLERGDPARILLYSADSEVALRWGMARGIRRFQGAHVDAMLAASRLAACHAAAGCTLRQCRERAASRVARGACANHPMLDAACP